MGTKEVGKLHSTFSTPGWTFQRDLPKGTPATMRDHLSKEGRPKKESYKKGPLNWTYIGHLHLVKKQYPAAYQMHWFLLYNLSSCWWETVSKSLVGIHFQDADFEYNGPIMTSMIILYIKLDMRIKKDKESGRSKWWAEKQRTAKARGRGSTIFNKG